MITLLKFSLNDIPMHDAKNPFLILNTMGKFFNELKVPRKFLIFLEILSIEDLILFLYLVLLKRKREVVRLGEIKM